MKPDFTKPEYYINRELSWLEFNARVLGEAADPAQPLLERVRFLSIFGSNLDEFFEVRIAGLKQQIEHKSTVVGPDHMTAADTFEASQKRAHELVDWAYQIWNKDLIPALAKEGIHIHKSGDLSAESLAWSEKYFREEIFPTLTPLAVDPSHPFPQLANKSHNLIVALNRPHDGPAYAIVQIPRLFPRLQRIPDGEVGSMGPGRHFVFLQGIIRRHLALLFPGIEVKESHAFRMTRNSDLYIDDEEAENLLETIEDELRRRSKGNAVRLEVAAVCPDEIARFLLENLSLGPDDLYRLDGPINFLHLESLYGAADFPRLKDKPFQPVIARALAAGTDIFEVLRRQDVLLHHPYEGFGSVIEVLEKAADDPNVLALKLTLYRTSVDSPIVRALMHAAEHHKQVTVLVELKARFDEENNIRWARALAEAGVHVVYGMVGLKTHCKMLLIVRRDDDRVRLYAHLGTGNYNNSTARFYTDLGLLTANPDITSEVAAVFNNLTGLSEFHGGRKLILAPFEMRDRFLALIARERDLGKKGRIIVKLNSLVDERAIAALYEAAAAGAEIDLIIRGISCLRPGVPGVSENIRVRSIVGRFLEHSRIYYFGNGGKPLVYLGSADWMGRNFDRRVEVVFPVEDPALRARITDEILPAFLSDNVKAHLLRPDSRYEKAARAAKAKTHQSQLHFRQLAREQHLRVT
jgi:polyphosphate kinase